MKLIKRDGTEVEFDKLKISNAIKKANREVEGSDKLSEDEILNIANKIEKETSESLSTLTVEDIQNKVEDSIYSLQKYELGRRYSQYRFKRAILRNKNTTDDAIISLINYENEEIKQENSNKNPRINSVQRDYMAGEVSKDITKRFLLPDDIWEAHENGIIHFHDADYFAQKMHNCFNENTRLITNEGVKSFKEFKDNELIKVLDKDGVWRNATVHRYGKQVMQKVVLVSNRNTKKIICTQNHRWILQDGTETTNLQEGMNLYPLHKMDYDFDVKTKKQALAFTAGFTIGDGDDATNHMKIRLCGNKIEYADIFKMAGYSITSPKYLNGCDMIAHKNGIFKQDFLNGKAWRFMDTESKIFLFLGYFAADGNASVNKISTSDTRVCEMIESISGLAGFHICTKCETLHSTNYKNIILYEYSFRKCQDDNNTWKVKSIKPYRQGIEQEAWCVEEPITHSFTLEGGIVTGNCGLVNLDDMLNNGTVISSTLIEKPHSFSTACNIMTQIMAQVASSQFGGQSMTLAHIAPFVDISRQKIKKSVIDEMSSIGVELDDDSINKVTEQRLYEEIKRGVQMIQYQTITLQTTNGQAPFVTLFLYIDEVPEGRTRDDLVLIIDEILRQRYIGVKNEKGAWVTPAFPKLIYVLDEDNIHEDSKYYWLTKKAAKCTSRRLVPDYVSAKKMKELKNGNVFPMMGCRSALSVEDNVLNEDGTHKFYGRFNQGVVTINLVDVALSSGGDFDKFWEIYEKRLEICHRALRCRHERLLGTPSDVAPILWQYGAYARLKKGEVIDKLLYGGYSTISLGYAGLYECVKAMTGESHTYDKITESGVIPRDFAMLVMEKLNSKCEEWKKAENIAYSVYGTPLESTTYKFAKCLRKRFGVIEGVTDHNYITNSYHVNVREEIDAFSKLAFEAPFQKLSPGGAISYVETPNLEKNIDAILDVMKFIYDNIMYAELNTKSDYCQVCGSTDEIKIVKDDSGKLIWRCPHCGNTDQNKMNVARRTCGYIGTEFWNQGRTQEIYDRVIHLDNKDA